MHRQYVITALGYGLLGLLLGIYMAHSQNHLQHVTHAHIMLIGFVVSLSTASATSCGWRGSTTCWEKSR